MERIVGTGFIGAGHVAETHMLAWQQISGTKPAAVCRRDSIFTAGRQDGSAAPGRRNAASSHGNRRGRFIGSMCDGCDAVCAPFADIVEAINTGHEPVVS